MEKKGWPKRDLDRTVRILESAEKKKKYKLFKESSNRILYWISILILITVNLLVSIVLVPFLIVLKGYALYSIVALLALVFGLIFNFLITDIEHLDKRHHIFAAILIPLMAVINIFVIVGAANRIDELLKIPIYHNPITVSVVYVVVFVMPYLFSGAKRLFE